MFEQSIVADDQPKAESTQQNEQDQVNEQPEATGDSKESESAKDSYVELDGEKVSIDQLKEWKQGYMRTQDYTKKTQELADEKRKLVRSDEPTKEVDEIDPDVAAALDALKKAGVVTKDDLAKQKAYEEDQKALKKLLKANPELKAHEKALRQIGLTDNRAWSDIAVEYGFVAKDKLSKAQAATPIAGTRGVPEPPKEKSVGDMTSNEYALWKKENLGRGQWL